MSQQASYREAAAERRTQAIPFAHLSVELGHLYFDDLAKGAEHIEKHFRLVAPWATAARAVVSETLKTKTPRVSSCFLVDDYLTPIGPPAVVVPELLKMAKACGLEIDYLVRESACVEADGVPLARLVEERVVADPPPETTGVRPPVTETGWLCNGERSPNATAVEAMEPAHGWRPPTENATTRHSIFVDVELWDERKRERTWSCAFLAAVWQLLRLGLLRHRGARVAVARPWQGDLPDRWDRLPAIVRLREHAAPFSAYRSLSVLPGRFIATEHAVRTILSQVAVEPTVALQAVNRASAEGIALPVEPVDRLEYVFTGRVVPDFSTPSPIAGSTLGGL